VFLARRPVQGSPSVVLTWPGGLGAFAGASPVGAFVQSEVPARRETLSLNGLPFGIALARTLWAQTPEDLEARVLGLSARNGNRVLLDVFEPRIRHVAVFAPATSPVRQRHEQEAWVLVPAGSTGDDPRGKAMDERLGAYETRPDRGHAVELAVSGRTSRELPVITIGRSAISWVRGVDAFGRRRPVSYRFPWP
jgi:hypothetical protein